MSFDDSKGSVMLEFNFVSAKTPTIADVKQLFKLADHEIDEACDIVPMKKTFIAVVSSEAGARLKKEKPAGFVQTWSNAKIEPFGPVF